jgi:pimeloyl-ACP methyl ester carboxylesterase
MGRAILGVVTLWASSALAYTPRVPPVSPATKLPNQIYKWRDHQQIRYQVAGPEDGEPVVLVHGLFVNSDHWRRTLKGLADEGYRAYAIDLWGCGYSSKPPFDSPEAQSVNGEEGRFNDDDDAVLKNVQLGTASGKGTRVVDVELSHPLKSPYNFYTWSELITDFCQQVIPQDHVTLVCNSIGTMSSLQAVLDTPDLYRGCFIISPNFRELHSAEAAAPAITMPIIRFIQKLLRNKGQGLFDALAKPDTVKTILKEPYAVESAVDDILVEVLLDPLLTEGASNVVFDTLSYSAGPLPEQQLSSFPKDKPVWVCYGKSDPWTPGGRVEALISKPPVERVVAWDGVGHCPHDEAPELVHPLLFEFLNRVCADDACATPAGEKAATS